MVDGFNTWWNGRQLCCIKRTTMITAKPPAAIYRFIIVADIIYCNNIIPWGYKGYIDNACLLQSELNYTVLRGDNDACYTHLLWVAATYTISSWLLWSVRLWFCFVSTHKVNGKRSLETQWWYLSLSDTQLTVKVKK